MKTEAKIKYIDCDKVKEYRDELFKSVILSGRSKEFTEEQWDIFHKVFDYIFDLGQFAALNMIISNSEFEKREEN